MASTVGAAGIFSMTACLISACGGTSLAITPKPDRLVCPGTPITLSWQASRPPTISASRPVQGLEDLPDFGARQVSIAAGTHFLIRGGDWWWANQLPADVTVYDPGLAQFPATGTSALQLAKIGTEVRCSGDKAWVAFEQRDDHWDPRLTVGSVRALGGATVTVWHNGARAEVAATPNASFQNLPMQGVWLFETACHPRPRVVGIELTATCSPTSPSGGTP